MALDGALDHLRRRAGLTVRGGDRGPTGSAGTRGTRVVAGRRADAAGRAARPGGAAAAPAGGRSTWPAGGARSRCGWPRAGSWWTRSTSPRSGWPPAAGLAAPARGRRPGAVVAARPRRRPAGRLLRAATTWWSASGSAIPRLYPQLARPARARRAAGGDRAVRGGRRAGGAVPGRRRASCRRRSPALRGAGPPGGRRRGRACWPAASADGVSGAPAPVRAPARIRRPAPRLATSAASAGGDRHRGDQPDAADQRAHDLGGHVLRGTHVAERPAGQREQQQQRQRRAGVGQHQRVHRRGHVVAPDPHGRREQRGRPQPRVGPAQLPDRAGLGDGDVVQHAQRADDHPGQQQAARVDPGAQRGDQVARSGRRAR